MASMESSVWVNATPEALDAYVLDARRWVEWYPGLESAKPDATFPNPGGSVAVRAKVGAMAFDLTFTVAEWIPQQSIAFQIEGAFSGTSTYAYTPEGSGLRLTGHFDYDMPGGVLGQIADKLVVERMNAQNLEQSLHNLAGMFGG